MKFLAQGNNPGLQVFWSVKYTMVKSHMYSMVLVGIQYSYPLFLRLIKCIYIHFKLFDSKNVNGFVKISRKSVFSGPDFIQKSTILEKFVCFILNQVILHVMTKLG